MIETDRLTREIGQKAGVMVIGSHNPRDFALTPDNFIDDMLVSAELLGLIK